MKRRDPKIHWLQSRLCTEVSRTSRVHMTIGSVTCRVCQFHYVLAKAQQAKAELHACGVAGGLALTLVERSQVVRQFASLTGFNVLAERYGLAHTWVGKPVTPVTDGGVKRG